jgi:hypothetical protein
MGGKIFEHAFSRDRGEKKKSKSVSTTPDTRENLKGYPLNPT